MNLSVLHIYRTYFPDPPGGMQEAIRQLCLATQNEDISNTIFTLSPDCDPSVIERPEARVVRSRSWAAPASCDLGGYDAFATYKSLNVNADVLHFLFPWPFADLLYQSTSIKKPAVLTYVSDVVRQRWLGRVYSPLMWRTLRDMSAIVANCPAYAQTSPVLSDPEIAPKVRIIPLGIDELSYPKKSDNAILERLGLSGNVPYFLFLGVLRYYKGAHYLIEAARNLKAKVVIAGSGPEEESLKKLALQHGLDNVIFSGQVTDAEKVSLIKHCHALVLPSHLRSEAYGMVLVEASMFGKPMISCEIGTGTSYVNAHEQTGLVVPPASPEALADAMECLLNNETLTTRLGQGARHRYETFFSGPALGKAYSELFREVAS